MLTVRFKIFVYVSLSLSYSLQNTGTVVRGAKRAQFNVFMRPFAGITATQNLRTTLTPIFWIEEVNGMNTDTTHRCKPIRLLKLLRAVIIGVTRLQKYVFFYRNHNTKKKGLFTPKFSFCSNLSNYFPYIILIVAPKFFVNNHSICLNVGIRYKRILLNSTLFIY